MTGQPVRVFWSGPGRDRVWDLQSGSSGVVLDGGVTGQHFPEFDTIGVEPARKAGRIYRATRFKSRKVQLKVLVGDPFWAPKIRRRNEFRDLDSDWNDSLSETDPGRLFYVTNHGYRWLDLIVEGATDPAWVTEPGKSGMVRYEYTLGSDAAFYSGFDQDYVIHSAAEGFTSAPVFNVGEYDTYPVVRFQGPGRFTYGQPGRWTKLPELFAGQWIEVDTDPDVLTVTDQDGRNRRPELPRDHDLSFILPPNDSTTLYATVVGGGTNTKATATVTPRYRRAW